MRKFISRTIVFSIPLLLFLSPPLFILKITGENFTDIDHVITSRKKYLIGYKYEEKNYHHLKWKEVAIGDRKTILAMGSSRVLQFRREMFDSSFYNAGYTVRSISDFIPVLKSFPQNKYPKILLIGLDQFMFNKNWDNIKVDSLKHWDHELKNTLSRNVIMNVWRELIAGKYGKNIFLSNDSITKIGLKAAVKNFGFRNDGSLYYGNYIKRLVGKDSSEIDYIFKDVYKRIAKGDRRFEYGSEINPKALQSLDSLLNYCKKSKIFVVAIIPPFANQTNAAIERSGKYFYMPKIYCSSISLFQKYGFELHDMTHLRSFNSSDTEVIDGFHGGELAYLKILIKMIENNSILGNYTTKLRLYKDIEKKINNYQVYK